jgi:DHA1 family bicyclomycin/chloramphenicol resistance-like MFS transporter
VNHFLRLAIALGLITAVGPFAIDMYLPALPSIGASLHAGANAVQATLMAFFIVFGLCQLFYGPLADIVGRKLPIYGGLVLFTVGSIGCALSSDVQTLIAFRVVQSLGACAGMVVPRAIVRDLHTGHEATKLMSMLMLVMSVSPILAPSIGSFVIAAFGWRGVFWALTVAAAVALGLTIFVLDETRPREARRGSSWAGAFRSYVHLLQDWDFIGLTMVGGFGIASFFAYLGSASFVLQDHYGLTPGQFSLCFSLNAASFFGFSQLTGILTKRYGLPRVIKVASAGFALATAVTAAFFLARVDALPVMIVGLFIGYGFLGLVLPTSAVLSLEDHGAVAGTASALSGALQMIAGAIVMACGGWFSDGTAQPMIATIAVAAILSAGTAFAVLRRSRRSAATEAA